MSWRVSRRLGMALDRSRLGGQVTDGAAFSTDENDGHILLSDAGALVSFLPVQGCLVFGLLQYL